MNNEFLSTSVALFVRHPIPGQVKTRLARDIGDENACALYKAMVDDVLANIRACELPIFLFHDGLRAEGLPDLWQECAYKIYSQEGESLGDRMAAAFFRLFAHGAEKALLAGSDIPGIDGLLLQASIDGLDKSDVVFSPAFDGGYCLVAFRKEGYDDSIFRNIPWSTGTVLQKSIDACRAANLSYTLVGSRQDIDDIHDLEAYSRCMSSSAPATNNWLMDLGLSSIKPKSGVYK